MKKIAFVFAGVAAMALSACGDADDAADEAAVVETETTVPPPVVTETTTVVEDTEPTADDTVSVSEEGLEVDVDDGDTSVEADVDEDPSMTVRD